MRQVTRLAMNPLLARLLMILCLLGVPGLAHAQGKGPTYLWGIVTSGCRVDESLTHAVEAKLTRMGETVALVKQNPATDIGICSDKECAERFQRACPKASGSLMGGYLVQSKIRREGIVFSESSQGEDVWHRLRLWKVDLVTRQATIRDQVCQGCNLSDFVARHAAELMEQTTMEHQELSCQVGLSALSEGKMEPSLARSPERLVLLLTPVSREQRSVLREMMEMLRRHIRLTGRDVAVEERKSSGSLLDLRSRHAGKHLLEISLKTEGDVEIQFLEQSTVEPVTESLKCFGCSEDELAHRVTMTVSGLLDRCTGDLCRSGIQRIAMPRSTSICAPLLPPTDCESEPAPASTKSSAAAPVVSPSDSLVVPCPSSTIHQDVNPTGGGAVRPLLHSEGTRRQSQSMWKAGWTLLGIGVSGLAVMGTVLGLSTTTCPIPDVTYGDSRCQIPQGRLIELTSGLVGGGLVVTGAVLLGFSRRAPRPSTR